MRIVHARSNPLQSEGRKEKDMAMNMEYEYRLHLTIGEFTLSLPSGKEITAMLCNGDFKEAYEEIKRLSDELRNKQGKDKEV